MPYSRIVIHSRFIP